LKKDKVMDMEISFPGGARVDARQNGYTVRTDQPPHGGGEGTAPTPFSLFLASIGTCAGIYVLGFCRRRGISTEEITLRQSVRVDPSSGMVGHIDLDIQVPEDFPEKYKEPLIRTAELCAVKKHLEQPPSFSVRTETAEKIP
jgi:ribosomal protein S12 methylthiotransferase accessory factor